MQINLEPLHRTLTAYQLEILNTPHRFTVTIASTKAGKTYSHLVWLLTEWMLHGTHGNFWWVAPIFSQSKIAYKRLKRELLPFKIFTFHDSVLTISYNSKTIHFKSAGNSDSLYGDDVYAAVFDEFTRSNIESWYAIRSTLTKTKGKCKLIGNYTGDTNWGVLLQEDMKNNPEWAFFKITAFDAVAAGILDASEIEQARLDLPSEMFDALYLAKGGYEKERLIHTSAILDLFTNEYVNDGKRYITADIALMGSDLFVIMVWSGFRLLKVFSYPKQEGNEVIDNIKNIANEWNVSESNIAYDRDGIGSYLRGFMPNARPFNGNKAATVNKVYANRKAQINYNCANRINSGGYYIAPDAFTDIDKKRFIKELASLKSAGLDKDGTFKIQKKEQEKSTLGFSPDFRDGFALREYLELGTQIL